MFVLAPSLYFGAVYPYGSFQHRFDDYLMTIVNTIPDWMIFGSITYWVASCVAWVYAFVSHFFVPEGLYMFFYAPDIWFPGTIVVALMVMFFRTRAPF